MRIQLCILASSDKKPVVVARKNDISEVLNLAKKKFQSKRAKIKKPTRAFLSHPSLAICEIKTTLELADGDTIIVTEEDAPEGFPDAIEEEGLLPGEDAAKVQQILK